MSTHVRSSMYFIEGYESNYSKIFGLNIMLVKFIEDFVIKAYCNFVILLWFLHDCSWFTEFIKWVG